MSALLNYRRDEQTVRGSALASTCAFLRGLLGERGLVELVRANFPPQHGEMLLGQIVATQHYPLSVFNRLLDMVARVRADHLRDLREMGRALAAADLKGMYRLFVHASSVEKTLEGLHSMWARYFSEGDLSVVAREPNRWVLELEDSGTSSLYDQALAGFVEEAVSMAGGATALVMAERVAGGRVRFVVRWSSAA
jgi:hypothetical protein